MSHLENNKNNQDPNTWPCCFSMHNKYSIPLGRILLDSLLVKKMFYILLAALPSNEVIYINLNVNYIYAQLLRIIVPKSGENTNNYMHS